MNSEEKKTELLTPEIKRFWVKLAITLFSIFIFLALIVPDPESIGRSVESSLRNRGVTARMLLLSLVQNPAALYRLSEIDENAGKLDNAIMEMELAIGLLELHSANRQVLERYTERLAALRKKKI